MPSNEIGEMTSRVRVERAAGVRNSTNESVPTWILVATVWGEVIQLSGKVFWQAQAAGSEITHTVRIWKRRDVRPIAYRLVVGADVLEIESALTIDKTWLMCSCKLTKQG